MAADGDLILTPEQWVRFFAIAGIAKRRGFRLKRNGPLSAPFRVLRRDNGDCVYQHGDLDAVADWLR